MHCAGGGGGVGGGMGRNRGLGVVPQQVRSFTQGWEPSQAAEVSVS